MALVVGLRLFELRNGVGSMTPHEAATLLAFSPQGSPDDCWDVVTKILPRDNAPPAPQTTSGPLLPLLGVGGKLQSTWTLPLLLGM